MSIYRERPASRPNDLRDHRAGDPREPAGVPSDQHHCRRDLRGRALRGLRGSAGHRVAAHRSHRRDARRRTRAPAARRTSATPGDSPGQRPPSSAGRSWMRAPGSSSAAGFRPSSRSTSSTRAIRLRTGSSQRRHPGPGCALAKANRRSITSFRRMRLPNSRDCVTLGCALGADRPELGVVVQLRAVLDQEAVHARELVRLGR